MAAIWGYKGAMRGYRGAIQGHSLGIWAFEPCRAT